MYNDYINNLVCKLINKFITNDPFEIAKGLGITIYNKNMGNLKGFYFYYKKNRYIIINDELPYHERKIICAHELGHDQLHRHYAKYSALQDFMLYNMASRPEREANIFTSELLIPDREITENSEYTTGELSRILEINENYIKLKFEIIKKKYSINKLQQNNLEQQLFY